MILLLPVQQRWYTDIACNYSHVHRLMCPLSLSIQYLNYLLSRTVLLQDAIVLSEISSSSLEHFHL